MARAAAKAADGDSFYSVARINGIRAMVLTEQLAPGLAIQVAEPLTATDQEVASVGATLPLLSVVGVLAATLLGWAVARAGLAPVARLASVAEEVTLTGDPGRRVEVRRRDELGRLATSFNAMLSALQRSLDAQRRLVSDASHELRTPLASLRINADLLAGAPGDARPPSAAEVLDRVADQVEPSSAAWSSASPTWPGASRCRGSAREIRFDAVTSEALDAARRDWPKTEFDADLAACTVNGSADRLRVAVKNLLDNAAKFGPPEGPVAGPAGRRRAHRARPRPGHRPRRPAVRLRPLLPCARRPGRPPAPGSASPSSARSRSATAAR